MQVKNIMSRDLEVVSPQNSLREAAQKMKALDVGPVPVVENRRLVGILTDRDITLRAVAEGKNPLVAKVEEIMTREVISCFEDQEVEEAARLMGDNQIRRLMVLDHDKNLVGILSLGDIATQTGEQALAGEALEKVSRDEK